MGKMQITAIPKEGATNYSTNFRFLGSVSKEVERKIINMMSVWITPNIQNQSKATNEKTEKTFPATCGSYTTKGKTENAK